MPWKSNPKEKKQIWTHNKMEKSIRCLQIIISLISDLQESIERRNPYCAPFYVNSCDAHFDHTDCSP